MNSVYLGWQNQYNFFVPISREMPQDFGENLSPTVGALRVRLNPVLPCVREVVRCSTFLYFSGGRDRPSPWANLSSSNNLGKPL
jgi:hypothetical protein